MNKTIKAFTLGLTGSILALGVSMAAPQKAEAGVNVCHFGQAGQALEKDLCDVNRRVNANGHVVFDIKDLRSRLIGTVVLWNDDTAEWIRNGEVNRNIVTEDLPNDYIRLVNRDNDYNFVFQAR